MNPNPRFKRLGTRQPNLHHDASGYEFDYSSNSSSRFLGKSLNPKNLTQKSFQLLETNTQALDFPQQTPKASKVIVPLESVVETYKLQWAEKPEQRSATD